MRIWVDADSAPRDIRQIILRRGGLGGNTSGDSASVCFVSARKLPEIPEEMARHVAPGPDSTDSYIEGAARPGDLVITRDLPFAERIAEKGIAVINDKGDLFTAKTVAERRSLRDAATELRLLGIAPPSPRGSRRTAQDTKRFADALDRILASLKRQSQKG